MKRKKNIKDSSTYGILQKKKHRPEPTQKPVEDEPKSDHSDEDSKSTVIEKSVKDEKSNDDDKSVKESSDEAISGKEKSNKSKTSAFRSVSTFIPFIRKNGMYTVQ